ncbi:hypothetical protein [Desulfomicrobium escambiense]|uniref:hypothetical protein n=1 Tax=Desulfomicrobium escambiense TaxID=29503 RepID=UPI00041E47D4|nr:hypothetical protein [Desulfomicrobium escambiense]
MSAVWMPAARLVEIVGDGAALVLLRAYGGRALYLRRHEPHPDLVAMVGIEAAEALTREMGGTDVLFPSCAVRPATAKERLAPLLEAGISARDAARQAGCSTRFASEVRKDLGLSRPRPKRPKAARALIEGMIRAGRKDAEIAASCGVTCKHVWCVRLALQRRAQA